MPFTPSHPSILFPLKWVNKKYISLSGLVIGSMAPDFEYFIWMSPKAYISHSIHGIYLFNLPLTFLFALLFHIVIKRPFLHHFPFLKSNFTSAPFDFAGYLKKNWLVFTLSALFGILTHLLLDGFTHAQGYFVRNSNFLYEEIKLGTIDIRRCYLAWYISSIAGLFIVAFYAIDRNKVFKKGTYQSLKSDTKKFWISILLLCILLMVVRINLGLTWNWFRHTVIIAMGAFMYSLIIACWFENRRLIKNSV